MSGLAPGGILALDISTKTGWAYGHPSTRLTKPAAQGLWDLGGMIPSIAKPGAALADSLADAFEVMQPSLLIIEAPLAKQQSTARLLLGLAYVAELVAYRWSVRCREEMPQTVRKQIMGRGNGWKKPDIVSWVQARGIQTTDHNVADACILWFYAAALES